MFGPGRGASANPPKFGIFRGQTGRKADGRGIVSPRTFQARRGAFFALFAGSGSPPSHWGGGGRGQPDGEKTQPDGGAQLSFRPQFAGSGFAPAGVRLVGLSDGAAARPQSGAAGEGGAGDMMVLCRRYHLRRWRIPE